jgi:uncharacterized membrane protein
MTMDDGLGTLALAALLWVGAHLGIAGTRLRAAIVGRIGEGPFRGAFAAVSIAAIWFLVASYNAAPTTPLWHAPEWLRWVLALAMLLAFVLFVASVAAPNPTMVGDRRAAAAAAGDEPRGIQRVTRHPMLWSFAIWAAVHVLGNGDAASLLFFGAFLVTALAGMPSIDAKLAARDPARWATLAAATSILPFGAIAAGRNRLVPREIGWVAPVVGLVLWAAVLHLHRAVFGVAPVVLLG